MGLYRVAAGLSRKAGAGLETSTGIYVSTWSHAEMREIRFSFVEAFNAMGGTGFLLASVAEISRCLSLPLLRAGYATSLITTSEVVQ